MMRKCKPSFKPRLEILENRLCPSSYSVIDLPGLGGSTAISEARGVNDSSVVVGDATNTTSGNGFEHAVEWQVDATGKVVTTALPEIVSRASQANDINKSLQVVGYSDTTLNGPDPQTPNTPHAVLWQANAAGTFVVTDLGGLPNYPYTSAAGINNLGQVVGSGNNGSFQHTAFLWDSANGMRDLNSLLPVGSGWQLTGASDINDNGQVTGTGLISGASHAFLYNLATPTTPSSITDLGVFMAGNNSGANGLNSFGHVTGAAQTGAKDAYGNVISDAFLWKSNLLTNLGTLGTAGSSGLAVNDSDVVVGISLSTSRNSANSYNSLATRWQSGVATDLNKLIGSKPNWTLQRADDINTSGRIVGSGKFGTGPALQFHGFLLVPTSANLTAASTAIRPVADTLNPNQVQPLLMEALSRWAASGVDTNMISGVHVQIADLPGDILGQAVGDSIYIDADAAGWGWFVDPTPHKDSEFTTPGNQGEQNRMDLLTVLEHELGHLLGFDHQETGVMEDTLATTAHDANSKPANSSQGMAGCFRGGAGPMRSSATASRSRAAGPSPAWRTPLPARPPAAITRRHRAR
ncbi:MAG: DUF3466 family protein [Gemmataceae bacterium]